MPACSPRSRLVLSLDLELFWGVHDRDRSSAYGPNLDGVRAAVNGICERLERWSIHATWATVGLLMAHDADDARAAAPEERPTYVDPRLSPYRWLDHPPPGGAGRCFGPELVERVLATPHQELGSHTFSHLTCLEPGITAEQLRADLRAAIRIAGRFGVRPTSLVFPRNQYDGEHLRVAIEEGFTQVRGNPPVPMYRPRPEGEQHPGVRALRWLDALAPLAALHRLTFVPGPAPGGSVDVPASRFLRPTDGRPALHGLRIRRILAELRAAVAAGRSYHLWWHPHNFGIHLQDQLDGLEEILRHAAYLRDRYGLRSCTMAEVGEEVRRAA